MTPPTLVGHGLDSHRLETGRDLVLGGVHIPDAPRGPVAHSDGDVVLHAVADALLSCAALGDIGDHFPDTDPRWQGDSRPIVEGARRMLGEAGLTGVVNVAVVVVLDAPKLGPWRDAMAGSLAALLGLPKERVGVTFKTSEGLAPEHVQASATLLVAP